MENMETLSHIEGLLASHKGELFRRYPLADMAIFGSFARNEQKEDSDVDILVEFKAPVGMEFIDLANDLEGILKRRVDLVSRGGIKPKYFEVIKDQLKHV